MEMLVPGLIIGAWALLFIPLACLPLLSGAAEAGGVVTRREDRAPAPRAVDAPPVTVTRRGAAEDRRAA